MGHSPRVPVWLPWERPVIYFVTICVANRKPVLANERAFTTFKIAAANFATGSSPPLLSCPTMFTSLPRPEKIAQRTSAIFPAR